MDDSSPIALAYAEPSNNSAARWTRRSIFCLLLAVASAATALAFADINRALGDAERQNQFVARDSQRALDSIQELRRFQKKIFHLNTLTTRTVLLAHSPPRSDLMAAVFNALPAGTTLQTASIDATLPGGLVQVTLRGVAPTAADAGQLTRELRKLPNVLRLASRDAAAAANAPSTPSTAPSRLAGAMGANSAPFFVELLLSDQAAASVAAAK